MTGEEVKAAIERLQTSAGDTVVGVIISLIGDRELYYSDDWRAEDLRDTLVDLLRQADPHSHIEPPRDANGEPIHLSDEVESDHHEDGRVVGIWYREGVRVQIAVRPHGWDTATWCAPEEYRLHHVPTVEDVLREFGDEVRRCCDTEDTIAEYAAKLRKVMADE